MILYNTFSPPALFESTYILTVAPCIMSGVGFSMCSVIVLKSSEFGTFQTLNLQIKDVQFAVNEETGKNLHKIELKGF